MSLLEVPKPLMNQVLLLKSKDSHVMYEKRASDPQLTVSLKADLAARMEIISNISKSLPSKCVLVVKEHVHSYGVRSTNYYKQIQKIGNVFWCSIKLYYPLMTPLACSRNIFWSCGKIEYC